jgi:hypothetical protein
MNWYFMYLYIIYYFMYLYFMYSEFYVSIEQMNTYKFQYTYNYVIVQLNST